jgi:formylglycine-generating enzyme required for sulfatase activity
MSVADKLATFVVLGFCAAFGASTGVARERPAADPVAASTNPAPATSAFRDCDACPEMVPLPTGDFMMGSPASERYRFDNEGPQHPVHVGRRIAMGRYPVTAAEFAAWKKTTVPPDEGRFPAVMLTWFEANEYAAWLSAKTGHTYRLPTEAEYEYAERAGTVTPYYWGNDIGHGNANCPGCGSAVDGTGSTAVGSFPSNHFGLYDMAGDVFEWVADCYSETYDGAPTNAEVARQSADGNCAMRGLRASSWFNLPAFLRAAYRFREVPTSRSARRGFRVVREFDVSK